MPNSKVLFVYAFSFVVALHTAGLADEFYKDKTIKIFVGSASGTSYDSYARLEARHLGKHIPDHPLFIVQDMPGAGGITATNYVYNVAPKDGTAIGLFNRNTIVQPIVGNKRARYRSENFQWIGTPASFKDDPYLFFIHSSMPYRTAEDIRRSKKPITVSNSGDALIRSLKETLGLNIKVINGYDKPSANLAFIRGEVDGMGYGYSNLKQIYPDWFKTNYIRPIVQFGSEERSSIYPDVPTGLELATTEENRKLVEFMETPLSIAFPYAFPPDVPLIRVKLMRAAFEATMNDPAYQADVAKEHLSHSPKSGAEIQSTITRLASFPKGVIARYVQIAGSGGH